MLIMRFSQHTISRARARAAARARLQHLRARSSSCSCTYMIAMFRPLIALMIADSVASLHLVTGMRASRATTSKIAMSANFQDRRSVLSSASIALAVSALPTRPVLAADQPKVVIFGGSGYVGAFASQMLLAKGAEVVVASRKTPTDAQV